MTDNHGIAGLSENLAGYCGTSVGDRSLALWLNDASLTLPRFYASSYKVG